MQISGDLWVKRYQGFFKSHYRVFLEHPFKLKWPLWWNGLKVLQRINRRTPIYDEQHLLLDHTIKESTGAAALHKGSSSSRRRHKEKHFWSTFISMFISIPLPLSQTPPPTLSSSSASGKLGLPLNHIYWAKAMCECFLKVAANISSRASPPLSVSWCGLASWPAFPPVLL